jgi:hypothetical protein
MKKDYIKIYGEAYDKEKLVYEKEVKQKLLKLDLDEPADENIFCVQKGLSIDLKNNIVYDQPYFEITSFFNNKKMADGKKLKILPKYSYDQFEKLDDKKNLKLDFNAYVIELAKLNSREDSLNVYRKNTSLYELMHKAKDFSEFKIEKGINIEFTALFEKYKKIDNKKLDETTPFQGEDDMPKLTTENPIIDVNSTNIIVPTNNFKISSRIKDIISNKLFYEDLIKNGYIDGERTSFLNFKNVFIKDFSFPDANVVFFCDDSDALYFLKLLAKKIKGFFTQKNIAKSKKFRGYDYNPFSQSRISRSNEKISDNKMKEIETFLDKHL